MSFVQSFKLFFSNFSLCYKTLLYKVIAFILAISIIATFAYAPVAEVYSAGAFSGVSNIFKANGINEFFVLCKEAFASFTNVFLSMDTSVQTIFIIGSFSFVFLFGFLFNLDKISQTEVLSAKMSCNLKLGYTGQFFKKLGYSFIYSLVNVLYFTVGCVIIGTIYVLLLNIVNVSHVLNILAPFIIFLVIVILVALYLTIFGTHASSCVVNESGVFAGLFRGIKENFKSFFKVFSYNIGLVVFALILNIIAAAISAGALLILTLPCTFVFATVLETVIFYNQNGNRFYLDAQTIITPKQNENYDKVKNIIDII